MAHDAEAAQLEPPGISVRPVLCAAFASIALVLGAIWGLSTVYGWRVQNRMLPPPEPFPSPRVQTHQAEQRKDLLAAQRQQLTGYAWMDPDKTLLRIPIERAMEIIAQRGVNAYAPLPPPSHTAAAPAAGTEPAATGQAPSHDRPPAGFGGAGLRVKAGRGTRHADPPRKRGR